MRLLSLLTSCYLFFNSVEAMVDFKIHGFASTSISVNYQDCFNVFAETKLDLSFKLIKDIKVEINLKVSTIDESIELDEVYTLIQFDRDRLKIGYLKIFLGLENKQNFREDLSGLKSYIHDYLSPLGCIGFTGLWY